MEALLRKELIPGNYFFKDRDSLRNLIAFADNPFTQNTLFLSTRNKYALLVLMTTFGKVTLSKSYGQKILQKDLKTLIFPSEIDYDNIDILFDMIHKAHNSSNLSEVEKISMEKCFFNVFEYSYYESIFHLEKIENPLSFAEHVFTLDSFKEENPVELFKTLSDPDNFFRNNVKLFYVRYQNVLNFLKD